MYSLPFKNCKGCREDLPLFMFKDKFRERISPFCWECIRMKEEIKKERQLAKEQRKNRRKTAEEPLTQVIPADADDVPYQPINYVQFVLAELLVRAKRSGNPQHIKMAESLIENSSKVY